MLIVTRRIGEQVFIDGDSIKVMVLGLKGNQIRIGIEAPRSVSVHREEVYRRLNSQVDQCRQPACLEAGYCKCEVACNE